MPAAAVIPAPIAYIKVVAVKKLVVEFLGRCTLDSFNYICLSDIEPYWVLIYPYGELSFYFEKIRVFQAGNCPNILAWNNGIGLWFI